MLFNEFLAGAIDKCVNAGFTVTLKAAKEMDSGTPGYLDDEGKELAVATQYEWWKEIFIHEYCHFLQNKEGMFTPLDPEGKLNSWYDKEIELTSEEAAALTEEYMACELDCEKRSVEIVKDIYDLETTAEEYVKEANVYVFLYMVCLKHRKWVKRSIGIPELVEMVPATWLDDYRTLPEGFEKIALERCF